jgi:hypothetical protein
MMFSVACRINTNERKKYFQFLVATLLHTTVSSGEWRMGLKTFPLTGVTGV